MQGEPKAYPHFKERYCLHFISFAPGKQGLAWLIQPPAPSPEALLSRKQLHCRTAAVIPAQYRACAAVLQWKMFNRLCNSQPCKGLLLPISEQVKRCYSRTAQTCTCLIPFHTDVAKSSKTEPHLVLPTIPRAFFPLLILFLLVRQK